MTEMSPVVSIASEGRQDPVTLENGLRVPARFRAAYQEVPAGTTPQPPWMPSNSLTSPRVVSALELTIEVVDGSPVLTQLTFRRPADDPIARELVRDIPLRRVIDRVLTSASALLEMEDGTGSDRLRAERIDEIEALVKPFTRHQVDAKFLQEIAAVATANPRRPTAAIAEQFSTSHRNATRWKKRAMKEGFIKEETSDGD